MKRQTRTLLLNAATGVAIAATAALVFMPAVASAAPAVASTFVNVRANPSTSARVVNTLQRGQQVEVTECEGSWCFVEAPGRDGWVAAQFLNGIQPQSGVDLGFDITGPGGNTFRFGINAPVTVQPQPQPPVVEPSFGEACFYDRSQYRGDSFCVEGGEQIADLGDWDGEISSIENLDGLDVTVCTRTRFRGDCRTYTTSARSLGRFDDSIASIRVE